MKYKLSSYLGLLLLLFFFFFLLLHHLLWGRRYLA
jgi:hypothetical protein